MDTDKVLRNDKLFSSGTNRTVKYGRWTKVKVLVSLSVNVSNGAWVIVKFIALVIHCIFSIIIKFNLHFRAISLRVMIVERQ